jgi:elongation factor P--beta-lysine ligase
LIHDKNFAIMNQAEKAKDVKIGDRFAHYYANKESANSLIEVIEITDKTILFKRVNSDRTSRESRNTVENSIKKGYYRKVK